MQDFEFNQRKFRELLVYIADKTRDDLTFGSIKLNKVLYYVDFGAYRLLGRPITGATYHKLPAGPGPRELLAERQALVDQKALDLQVVPYFAGSSVKRIVALREPSREVFEPGELDLVDEVITQFEGMSGRAVSDFSHREPGWALAEYNETIPYETAWLSADPIEQETWEKAQELVNGLPR